MIARGFSIEGALSYGWSTFKANVGFFIPLALITFAVIMGAAIIITIIASQANAANSLMILLYVLEAILYMGWTNITLKYTRGEPATFGDLFQPMSEFFSFIVALVIFVVVVSIGAIFLIIPGLILALRFQFFGFFVVDQRCGPIEALGRSWRATQGLTWKLLGFGIVLWLINMVGALLLGIGLLATEPISVLAMADVYTKLRGSPGSESGTPGSFSS